ncbi:MAG: TolC family protein [Bryobacterales bacterium]|nr:TolC family protein [Bryobacterales bacterium]
MMPRCPTPAVLCTYLLASAAIAAETPLSLHDAVATALQEHPALQASADRVAVGEALRRQAALSPNPKLILQSENTRPYLNSSFVYWRDTDNFAYLQQTLETGGKKDRRVDLAAANIRRAELERELLRAQIAGRVKLAYWAAAGAGRIAALLREDRASFQRIIEYHEIRVREGAVAEADLIRVRLEGERLGIALNAADLEAERTRIHLFREMGRTEFPMATFADSMEPLPDTPAVDLEQALDRRAEVKLAMQMVDTARANLRLQQVTAKPNVDVLFGYKRATGYDSLIGGVQVDLPFQNRNQGNISAAESDIRVAESALAATKALVRAEIAAAGRDVEMRRKQLGESLQAMRKQAEDTARIAEAAYREGGADLLRLLDAQRVRIETQLFYQRALAEYRQSAVNLETALGVAP